MVEVTRWHHFILSILYLWCTSPHGLQTCPLPILFFGLHVKPSRCNNCWWFLVAILYTSLLRFMFLLQSHLVLTTVDDLLYWFCKHDHSVCSCCMWNQLGLTIVCDFGTTLFTPPKKIIISTHETQIVLITIQDDCLLNYLSNWRSAQELRTRIWVLIVMLPWF